VPLSVFSTATQAWFRSAFPAPTPIQAAGFPPIARGEHTLLCAPTGSGKTLAAFLAAIDRTAQLRASAEPGFRVVYVSPLKALAYDVERNLRVPLAGISAAAERVGAPLRPPRISIRTGDTSARERRAMAREPGQILITTPESLYLILGSRARETLRTVDTVIVDEIHVLASAKRGAHLALSLERLVDLTGREPQRIGLSATQNPLAEVARFLGGDRDVTIVDASQRPNLDLTIEVPAPMAGEAPAGEGGAWVGIHHRLVELIRAHRSTIVFANSRRLTERLAQRLNEIAGEELCRAHHGSLAREKRQEIEEQLKAGVLRGIVATSSLELGIDMGTVDFVAQIESPGSVSRGLQRVGRAGHGVGRRSRATIFPKFRGDLLEATVVAERMLAGRIEETRVPANPLDVLAQQVVAMTGDRTWRVADLAAAVRRAAPYRGLSADLLVAVLDMLAGKYPSDEFAELRPRLVWDRAADTVTARRDAKLVAIVNGGTIPDRGLYGVYLGEDGPRVGELDEEMVHESRVGQTFLLGASTWRIVDITRDRVIVKPAPGEPGRMPFWRGEGLGRPAELGRAVGAFLRGLADMDEGAARAMLVAHHGLDARAAEDLWLYLAEQRAATGTLPTDRAITVERFRDELGDWRICILSPYGAPVHAPWALAVERRIVDATGLDVQALWSDDGIVLRFADAEALPATELLFPDPDEIEDLVLAGLSGSALYGAHFRENAARALLLPRRRPGLRTPLWAQRLRAHNLLQAASRYPAFPIVLETYRECLNDVFDVPGLTALLAGKRAGAIRVDEVETRSASPFARGLVFAYVAAYMYEGDAPLAERKAQALTLDRSLLRELLAKEDLRDLLDPAAVDEVEAEVQGLARKVDRADAVHDLLRRVGDLTPAEVADRTDGDAAALLAELGGRAARVTVAGEERWIAVEDVARYRDALGVTPPAGLAAVWLAPADAPLESLLLRFARTHAPFAPRAPAARFGIDAAHVAAALRGAVAAGRVLEGEFRPGGAGQEYCDPDVLRRVRQKTLARLRHEVAPVEAPALARFLPRWHAIGAGRNGLPALRDAVAQLEGLPLPLAELEDAILPARVADFSPRLLDELGAHGEVVWVGRAAPGPGDGRIALYRRDHIATLGEPLAPVLPTQVHDKVWRHLDTRGASFLTDLWAAIPEVTRAEVEAALWDLVWAGMATNDTFQPLRARARPAGRARVPASGRWSSVSALRPGSANATETAHARATLLLDRYGVVSRAAAAAEGVPGGFAALAPVYRAMEEAGKIRRGHFVDGLGGAQYAHAAAVDRLRAARGDDGAATLSAIDPAQPYGALLPWPDAAGDAATPQRAAGARVVLARGIPVFYVERGGRKLRTFPADDDATDAGLTELKRLATGRRHGELRIGHLDGVPALKSPLSDLFERAGFRVEPDGLVWSA
jgi:ATP-dependent Lhr-like helicase